jgi:hypothetical protein
MERVGEDANGGGGSEGSEVRAACSHELVAANTHATPIPCPQQSNQGGGGRGARRTMVVCKHPPINLPTFSLLLETR